jgi:hypothetical protein
LHHCGCVHLPLYFRNHASQKGSHQISQEVHSWQQNQAGHLCYCHSIRARCRVHQLTPWLWVGGHSSHQATRTPKPAKKSWFRKQLRQSIATHRKYVACKIRLAKSNTREHPRSLPGPPTSGPATCYPHRWEGGHEVGPGVPTTDISSNG